MPPFRLLVLRAFAHPESDIAESLKPGPSLDAAISALREKGYINLFGITAAGRGAIARHRRGANDGTREAICTLMQAGLSQARVAARLAVAPQTVHVHVHHLRKQGRLPTTHPDR